MATFTQNFTFEDLSFISDQFSEHVSNKCAIQNEKFSRRR